MNIKLGINWVRPAAAMALLCAALSFSAIGQNKPGKPLDENEVRALVSRLKQRLQEARATNPGFEDAEEERLFELWDSRRDLAGKTQAQIIDLLHSYYLKIPKFKDALTGELLEDPWNDSDVGNLDAETWQEKPETETPVEPPAGPQKPGKTESSEEPVAPDTIRYYFANLPTDADTETWELGLTAASQSNKYLGVLVSLVFHRDTHGNLRGTGYFDIAFTAHSRGVEGFIKTVEGTEIGGKKIVITGTKKPQ